MGDYELHNEEIAVRIALLGAELKSLKDIKSGREYMWSGDPAFWKRVSPVLFPLVGNYRNKQAVYEGKAYPLSQHGFARDREFTLVSQTDEEAWFALDSDETTRECYPFDFRLEFGHENGRSVLREFCELRFGNLGRCREHLSHRFPQVSAHVARGLF